MTRLRALLALVCLGALGACADRAPPQELGGLWSAGAAACEAGVGVRFQADAIEAVYDDERQTLFARPHYVVERRGEAFRVRIRYNLPHRPGGARNPGARGELVLVRVGEGVALSSHQLLDGRTGAARVRLADDPAVRALNLQPCGPHQWRGDLRGLSTAPAQSQAPAQTS